MSIKYLRNLTQHVRLADQIAIVVLIKVPGNRVANQFTINLKEEIFGIGLILNPILWSWEGEGQTAQEDSPQGDSSCAAQRQLGGRGADGTRRFSLGRFFLCRSEAAGRERGRRHKKNLPRENLLVPPRRQLGGRGAGGTRSLALPKREQVGWERI